MKARSELGRRYLRYLAIAFACAALAALGLSLVKTAQTDTSIVKDDAGGPARDFEFTTMDGKTSSLHSYLGRPLWVNFFATWCPPCKAEIPTIEREYVAHKKDGLIVLGVDQEERPDVVAAFIRRFGITYPVVLDAGAGTLAYQVGSLPTSVLIKPDGTVLLVSLGEIPPKGIELLVDRLLASKKVTHG